MAIAHIATKLIAIDIAYSCAISVHFKAASAGNTLPNHHFPSGSGDVNTATECQQLGES
jgi:hypothetical protein